jgi:hypothetical protein
MGEIMTLPIASIRDPFLEEGAFDSTLPLTECDLLAHGWEGLAIQSRGKRSGAVFASAWPSASSPGYVHYSCVGAPDFIETYSKRPWVPKAVGFALDLMLKDHGLTAADLRWTPMSREPKRDGTPRPGVAALNEFVYFLGAGPFVKIGKTTGTPCGRISALQTGCPFPIVLLAHQQGGIKEEFALHRHFSKYRARADGEWFRNEGSLRQYIEQVSAVNRQKSVIPT